MLTLNLGGRFLSLEVTKDQEKFMSQPFIRRFFLFIVIFVATRNIVVAAGLAILVILFIGYLFNENSDLCVWRSSLEPPFPPPAPPSAPEMPTGLTPEESNILRKLMEKKAAAEEAAASIEKGPKDVEEEPNAYKTYVTNLKSVI